MTATPPDDHGQQHGEARGVPGPQHGGPGWDQGQQPPRSAYGWREDTSGPSYAPGEQPQGWSGPAGYVPPQPMRPEDQRLWATLVHIGGVFFPVVVPVLGYFLLRDRGQFLHDHTRTALNFHITMFIASAVGTITIWLGIGLLILGAVWLVTLVFAVLAAVAAYQGRYYAYPLSYEFVKH